jgi:hypothetical protein
MRSHRDHSRARLRHRARRVQRPAGGLAALALERPHLLCQPGVVEPEPTRLTACAGELLGEGGQDRPEVVQPLEEVVSLARRRSF